MIPYVGVMIFAFLVRIYVALPAAYAVFYFTGSYILAAPFLVPWLGFVIHWLSIKWDAAPSQGSPGNPYQTIRGDARLFKDIYQTIDERYPGGIYEPTVEGWLHKYGKWGCSYLWAGDRNVAMGLASRLGYKTTGFMPNPLDPNSDKSNWIIDGRNLRFIRGKDYQHWFRLFGNWYWVNGVEIYTKEDGTFWASPIISIKRKQ